MNDPGTYLYLAYLSQVACLSRYFTFYLSHVICTGNPDLTYHTKLLPRYGRHSILL